MLCRWKWISPLTFLSMNLSTQHLGCVEIYAACFRLKTCHPRSTACYKSEDADWDIPIWLLAKCLGLVMNAAITRWCMKNEAHHYLLSIMPEHSSCFFPLQGGIRFWIQNNNNKFFSFNLFKYNRNYLMNCDSSRSYIFWYLYPLLDTDRKKWTVPGKKKDSQSQMGQPTSES